MQIPEHWRFDETETGRHHGTRLGGNILVDGQYRPAAIEEIGAGYSRDIARCWTCTLRGDRGEPLWIDPGTGHPIATLEDKRARAHRERKTRIEEREARLAAEARVRKLGEENRRLREG